MNVLKGKTINILLKICLSGGLMYLLYRATPLQDILLLIVNIDGRYLIPVFILLFANTVLSALKWRQFLLVDGVDIPLAVLTKTYLVGSFCNMFLPSSIGGDYYRIYDIARRSKETVRSAASVFADRFSGFLAMITLALISSIIVSWRIDNVLFFIGPLCIFAFIVALVIALYKETPFRFLLRLTRLNRLSVVDRVTDKLFLSFQRYGSSPRFLMKIMLLSFTFQLSVIAVSFLLALSLKASVPFFYFSAFIPLINLMEALPISIFGIGIRDVGYVFFFEWAGLTEIQTRSLAILFLAVTVCYSLCGGVIFIQRFFSSKE